MDPMMLSESITPPSDPTQMMMQLSAQFQELNQKIEENAQRTQEQVDRLLEQARQDRQLLREALAAIRIPRMRLSKPPKFYLEKGKCEKAFATWKSKWGYYLTGSGIAEMQGPSKAGLTRAVLQQALSDYTIQWIGTQGLNEEQIEDAEFIIGHIEDYLKMYASPMFHAVEALRMKHLPNEPVADYFSRLQEKIKLCQFDKITDMTDWFKTLCTCLNIYSNETRKKLFLEKDLTFERAVEIVLAAERRWNLKQEFASGYIRVLDDLKIVMKKSSF